MAATGYGVDVRKRRRIAKERAFVPLLGSDYGAILNTTFEEPKNPPFYLLKIPPLIRTAAKCIKRAGDSKEESPISSSVGSDYGATLNTAFQMRCSMRHRSLSRFKGRGAPLENPGPFLILQHSH